MPMAYIGGVGVDREKCDDVAAAGYRGFAFSLVVKPDPLTTGSWPATRRRRPPAQHPFRGKSHPWSVLTWPTPTR
jgi:hypothetical protein